MTLHWKIFCAHKFQEKLPTKHSSSSQLSCNPITANRGAQIVVGKVISLTDSEFIYASRENFWCG